MNDASASSSPPPSTAAPQAPPTTTQFKRKTAAKDCLAGACAGCVSKTVVAPIERVKLLMQLQFSLDKKSSDGNNVAQRVYREQGVLAFWRGNTPNVMTQAGTAALNFLLMDAYKSAISPLLLWSLSLPSDRSPEKRKKRRALVSSFLSGGLAGGTVLTVLYPLVFARTRLAMDVGRGTIDAPRKYPGGMRDVFKSIWKADGWRGFYQGYGIALAGVVVYRALHLGGYDAVKTEILHRRGHRFVSITAGTACYPIDSVRRRLMMQAGLPKEDRLYKNSFDCFRKVSSVEGIRGFYLGIGPNLIRSFGAALLLVSYDVFKVML
ncbi:predicted protein [Thalassiosira pseudonana CCMP1335]|uniref:ADP/ATP translocase n=1 Tax=Thalassiosira pseudonana TaxID=35128 RepID=B8C0H5_THAPS|nr:predicted protein [Thalassiosira pseudonana CCMP1335]EED93518.1 predicted protein [Thalassiosira pseudonana CCMP1335]